MNNIEEIQKILEENNGLIKTSELKEKNISRGYLKILQDDGVLERISRGIYVSSNSIEDEFYCMQQRYKKSVFSHNTALYFHDLTDRTPLKFDVTFCSNYRIRKNPKINAHYVKEELFDIGILIIDSPKGNKLKVYNLERTICDLLKDRNKVDSQIVINAITRYAKRKNKDLSLLNKYSIIFKVEKILRQYMGVLT